MKGYEILWERDYKKGYANCRVAVDSKDNILVCGIDKDYKGMVIKYDKDGNLIWVDHTLPQIYKKKILDINYSKLKIGKLEENFGGFLDICIDKNDNIVVVGSFYEGREKCIVYIKKYDSNGNKIWGRKFSLFDYNQSTGVKCDVNGNVLIVGYGGNTRPPILRGFIAKFSSSDGKILWWKKLGKIGKIFTGYTSLVISQNNIYTAGITAGLRDYNLILTKFKDRWKIKDKIIDRRVLPGKILMDREGNLIVVGQIENGEFKHFVSTFNQEFDILWESKEMVGGLYDGCLFKNDIAVTGKIDQNEYYAGIYNNKGEKLLDFYLGKLVSNGQDINDWMKGIAVDSMSNIIVVGGAPIAKTIKVKVIEKIRMKRIKEERKREEKEKEKGFMDILIELFRRLFRK